MKCQGCCLLASNLPVKIHKGGSDNKFKIVSLLRILFAVLSTQLFDNRQTEDLQKENYFSFDPATIFIYFILIALLAEPDPAKIVKQ